MRHKRYLAFSSQHARLHFDDPFLIRWASSRITRSHFVVISTDLSGVRASRATILYVVITTSYMPTARFSMPSRFGPWKITVRNRGAVKAVQQRKTYGAVGGAYIPTRSSSLFHWSASDTGQTTRVARTYVSSSSWVAGLEQIRAML